MSGHPAPAPPVSRVLPLVPELSLFVPSLTPDQVKGVSCSSILLLKYFLTPRVSAAAGAGSWCWAAPRASPAPAPAAAPVRAVAAVPQHRGHALPQVGGIFIIIVCIVKFPDTIIFKDWL